MTKTISVIVFLLISLFGYAQEVNSHKLDSIFEKLQEIRHDDSLRAVKELNILKAKYFNNAHNDTVVYYIGRLYYKDFLLPYANIDTTSFEYLYQMQRNAYDSISFVLQERYFKKSFFENSADSALFYFKQIKNLDSKWGKALFFVTEQLECFINSDSSFVDLSNMVSAADYIPFWYLANLNEDWKCDKSKDYLDLVFTSLIITPDEHSCLSYMNEPPLYQMELSQNSDIFRLAYEPSFDNDICIRVEKNDDKIVLFWKEGCNKNYRAMRIKRKGKKEISLKTWQYLMQLVHDFNFLNLPNRSDPVIFCDGASWFFEYKTNTTYKAHYNRMPDRNMETLSLYLLELSGVKYKTDKWEPGYYRYDLVLTKDEKYIITEDLEETIIACLNQHIDNKKLDCECCYFDSYLKFNRHGRIKIVRYPDDENWFIDKWYGFQDRKCRKEMKKALRNLDLSYLNAKKPIYFYLQVDYDKESQMFKKRDE